MKKWQGKTQKQQREKLGYSQGELAKLIGVTQGNISALEMKLTQPRVGMAMDIARVLQKPLDFFIK